MSARRGTVSMRVLVLLLVLLASGCQMMAGDVPPGLIFGPRLCPKDLPPDYACASR